MIELYTTLIIYHRRSFDSIPDRYKESVKANLAMKGYDTNGNPKPQEN